MLAEGAEPGFSKGKTPLATRASGYLLPFAGRDVGCLGLPRSWGLGGQRSGQRKGCLAPRTPYFKVPDGISPTPPRCGLPKAGWVGLHVSREQVA